LHDYSLELNARFVLLASAQAQPDLDSVTGWGQSGRTAQQGARYSIPL